jgi:signal transduction histidine kinase/CheY-like chemotaxis protein
MTLKEFLSIFYRKLSIRIFLSSLVFIILLSSVFYFIGKSILINNSKNNFICTFLSCSNLLSSELTAQKNLVLISNSIIHPIISNSISELKLKNLENSISREILPILKNQNPDIFFIRFLPITGFSSDYITFSKQNKTYLIEKGISKNKKILKLSEWWNSTIKNGEYFGAYFPNQNSVVYSKILYYNGIPAAVIGAVSKKNSINSAYFKLNKYNTMQFQILKNDFTPFYNSSDLKGYDFNHSNSTFDANNIIRFNLSDDYATALYSFPDKTYIRATISSEEFLKPIFYLKIYLLLFFFISSILALFLSIAVEKKLSKPMSRILKLFRAASKGNFSTDISPISKGNFGNIEREFNILIASLRNLNSELIISRTHAEFTAFSKTQFISNISREIRAPLDNIAGIIDILKTSSLSEAQKRHFSIIENSTSSLIDTFNEIIEFLKIESGTSILKFSELNLKELVLSISSAYYFSAERKGVSFSNYIDKSIPATLFCDKQKISLILSNILDNAVKFTNSGNISLSVLNTEDYPEFCSITFSISDTGIGIPEENRNKIFSNFSSHNILNKNNKGLGIGLSIVNHNLKFLGSNLEFSSQENGGSKFFFTISFKKTCALNKHNIQNDFHINNTGDKKVLIVDDNSANLDIIETFLKDEPITLFKAYNGKDAISIIEETHLDLILLDLQMPDLNGFQISRIIREKENNCGRRVPIIAMTAYVFNEDYDECIRNGIDDCLIKPFNSIEISDIIKKWIK